jgi:hypothetical protein
MLKGTNDRTEPDSIETLDLEPSFCHEWNSKEYLRIAVDPEDGKGENGTLSLVVVYFDKDWKCKSIQSCLTMQEIDLVINALIESKKRMQSLNTQDGV